MAASIECWKARRNGALSSGRMFRSSLVGFHDLAPIFCTVKCLSHGVRIHANYVLDGMLRRRVR